MSNHRCTALIASILLAACSPPEKAATPAAAAADDSAGSWPYGAMVAAANPAAVHAAISVLEQGGNAVDAAIAAHAVLGLVEPESSGIGGSAFMLVYDRASDTVTLFDGRETAPSSATRDMFVIDGEVPGFMQRWAAGLSIGVPGTVALYRAAHGRFGEVDWDTLFAPAISLATDGFEVTPKLVMYNDRLGDVVLTGAFPNTGDYLFPGGTSIAAGDTITNTEYAATLGRIANEGIDVFYRGDIAEAIVARVAAAPMAGSMTAQDLANYQPIERQPVCGAFRDNSVCSASPPSSGVAVAMIPALYDAMLSPDDTTLEDKVSVFVDAQRLAYADRDYYVADADFVDVPLDALLDPAYLAQRATERFAPGASPTHGNPLAFRTMDEAAWLRGPDRTLEMAGTTHLSIIDGDGNAVAMTASVGAPFGSLRMTNGFFLNNEMTDFSVEPPADGEPWPANAIAADKRPRSSMSPTILFDADGELLMVTGSPGGNSIIAYTTKTILGVLDWGLSPQEAADFPNIIARGDTVRIESLGPGATLAEGMTARGYNVTPSGGENSGLHLIVVGPDGLKGAADSRRHGIVATIPPAE